MQHHDRVEDRRRHGFVAIDNEVIDLYAARLGAPAILMYCILVRFAGSDPSCYPSVPTLITRSGLSKNSVLKAIGVLEEAQLIAVKKRVDTYGRHLSNLYMLLPVPCGEGSKFEPLTPSDGTINSFTTLHIFQ